MFELTGSPDTDEVLLVGGYYSPDTTELLNDEGGSDELFKLKHDS